MRKKYFAPALTNYRLAPMQMLADSPTNITEGGLGIEGEGNDSKAFLGSVLDDEPAWGSND